MSYGSIFGATVNEFERQYRDYTDKKNAYEAEVAKWQAKGKNAATVAKKAASKKSKMDRAWTKALHTARTLNTKGKLPENAAQRMGLVWNSGSSTVEATPTTFVDPTTGQMVSTSSVLQPQAPTSSGVGTSLAIGGIAVLVLAGALILKRRKG